MTQFFNQKIIRNKRKLSQQSLDPDNTNKSFVKDNSMETVLDGRRQGQWISQKVNAKSTKATTKAKTSKMSCDEMK